MNPSDSSASRHRFGEFELDVDNRQLLLRGEALPLRARPFDLLVALVENAGRLVTKDALLDRVWPKLVVEENNLQVHVAALRKLLGHDAIATVPGRGYRFTRRLEASDVQGGRAGGGSTVAASAAGSAAAASAARDAPNANDALPDSATALFGRDADVDALSGWLRQHRLVTVTGSGGIGKTRLAQAVARRLAAGGTTAEWIELAPLSDPALVASHIATALGIDVPTGAEPLSSLVAALRGREIVLVLDNAEHVLGAVAEIATALAVGTPHVRLLVTSQAPLRVSAEHVYRLAALEAPPADLARCADAAQRFPAVAFFAARAKAADRRFALDEANCRAVSEICRRLDGVPLQLELAAARVPLLGVDALASRLDECLRLLRRGSRDAPTRQQTLEAVFDWSYELLSGDEQAVFRSLSALVGPFSLDEACAVARDEGGDARLDDWTVIDLLGALVDRSLVAVEGGDAPRYRLLETGRAYARDKLRAAGEMGALQRASALYQQAGDAASSASHSADAVRLYSAALEAALLLPASPERDARELDIHLKLGPAVQTTLGPAHPRCEEIYRRAVELARGRDADARAFKALWGYWHFLCMAGRDAEAAPYADEIVAMGRALHDDGLELEACHAALTTQQLLGNAPAMVANAERAIALYDHDRHHHLTYAFGGHDPGICALGQGSVGLWLTGHPDRALAMARDALALGAKVQHGYSRAVAYYYTAMTYAACGRRDEFRFAAERLAALSHEHEMEMLGTEARFFVGCVRCEAGNDEPGIAEMHDALAAIEAGGDLAFVLFYIALLAEARLGRGDADAARTLLDRGFLHAMVGQGFFLPELHRLRGEVLRANGDTRAARREFVAARDLADAQGAKSLALRAAMSLVRADAPQAREELARRLAQIDGGADTKDGIAARALLG
jgi:predicted ATPase/DNA-binding winged helix-turn-helix (wHTH) protein